jgi:hypothetical protein
VPAESGKLEIHVGKSASPGGSPEALFQRELAYSLK